MKNKLSLIGPEMNSNVGICEKIDLLAESNYLARESNLVSTLTSAVYL